MIEELKEALTQYDKMECALFLMKDWKIAPEIETEAESKNEKDEDKDYRDVTHGDRNSKHLLKARMYANTPKARLKRERTELRKDLNR